jgi:hypothetical protein
MIRYGDPRLTDKQKLARGQPSVALVDDPEMRRFSEQSTQNINYLLRKFGEVRIDPEFERNPRKYPLDDVTKKLNKDQGTKRKTLRPEVVMTSGLWVEPTSGSIAGRVKANGFATSYYFQYVGVEYDPASHSYPLPDFSLATKTATQSAGNSTIAVLKAESIAGLSVPRRYYVRLVAWNANRYAFSNVLPFETGLLPAVTLSAASAIAVETATISGTVDPNSLDTTYYFEYGTTPALGTKTATGNAGSGTSPVAVSAGLTGLVKDTTYYYRLTASNAVGTASTSINSFKTLAKEMPVVTILPDSFRGDTYTTLNGTVNPKGLETSYYFEYGFTSAFGSVTATESAGSAEGVIAVPAGITGLIPDTVYVYRLVAANESGTAYSANQTLITNHAEIELTGSLSFDDVFEGSTGTQDLVANIKNSGDNPSTLNWSGNLTLDAGLTGKVSADSLSGMLSYNDDHDVTVTLARSGIIAGSYSGILSVSDPHLESKTLPISLKVLPVYHGDILVRSIDHYGHPGDETDSGWLTYTRDPSPGGGNLNMWTNAAQLWQDPDGGFFYRNYSVGYSLQNPEAKECIGLANPCATISPDSEGCPVGEFVGYWYNIGNCAPYIVSYGTRVTKIMVKHP